MKVKCLKNTNKSNAVFLSGKEYPAVFDAVGFLYAQGEDGEFVKIMACRKDAVFNQHFEIKN